MPRKRGFCYDKDQHSRNCLIEKIEGKRRRLHISQCDVGTAIGITQQGYAYRLNPKKGNASFTFIELVKLFDVLQFTDDEIVEMMRQE